MAPLLQLWTCIDSLLPPTSTVYIKVHFGVGHCISLCKYRMTCFCHNNTTASIFTTPTVMSAFPVLHALTYSVSHSVLLQAAPHGVPCCGTERTSSLSVRLWLERWLVCIEPAKIFYYTFYNDSIIYVNFRKFSEVWRRKITFSVK